MKKTLFIVMMLLSALVGRAQNNVVTFTLHPVDQKEVDADAAKWVSEKLATAMALYDVVAGDEASEFSIRPSLSIINNTPYADTKGGLTYAEGELTLRAVNDFDGTVYLAYPFHYKVSDYCTTQLQAWKSMLKNLNGSEISDFIDLARLKIDIFRKKQAPVPDTVVVRDTLVQERVIKQVIERERIVRDTVVQVLVEESVVHDTVTVAPTAPLPKYQIKHSNEEFTMEITACVGDKSTGRVKITTRIVNNSGSVEPHLQFDNAFDTEGDEGSLHLHKPDAYRADYVDLPIAVKRSFDFYSSSAKLRPSFSFLKFTVGRCVIEVRNLPITWQ